MRNMSFAMTVKQIQEGTKTVTRRFGWWFLKSGDLVLPVRKSMGLRKGEKVQPLRGPIRIVATQAELLREISAEDCAREGFPTFSPSDFVRMMEKKYGPFSGLRTTNRIEFEYTDNGVARIPPHFSCGDCAHLERCAALFDGHEDNDVCGFDPPRFRLRPED